MPLPLTSSLSNPPQNPFSEFPAIHRLVQLISPTSPQEEVGSKISELSPSDHEQYLLLISSLKSQLMSDSERSV